MRQYARLLAPSRLSALSLRIIQAMVSTFCLFITRFLLSIAHFLGAGLGLFIMVCSPKTKQQTLANMQQSGLLPSKNAACANFIELGKTILETPLIWASSTQQIQQLVSAVHGWENVKQAQAAGKGIIFLTPHIGSFEITSRYYALHAAITVLYRPPKKAWLTPLFNKGRQHNNVLLAPANMHGVKALMQALKRGEAIGILPDQIPQAGEGEWSVFFGKPAYTMTLASKLAKKTGAVVIMAFGERLKNAKGFEIHLQKIESIDSPALLNIAIERQIAQNPLQYLWQYNRHKISRKAKPQQ